MDLPRDGIAAEADPRSPRLGCFPRCVVVATGALRLPQRHDEEQVRLVDTFIAVALSNIDESDVERSAKAVAMFSSFYIYYLAPAFKDPAFEEEREWRIVIGPGASPLEICFRPGKSMVIPYWQFVLCAETAQLEIEKIYVGPNPHGFLSGWSAIDATTRYNARSREGVHQSSIPYRSW